MPLMGNRQGWAISDQSTHGLLAMGDRSKDYLMPGLSVPVSCDEAENFTTLRSAI